MVLTSKIKKYFKIARSQQEIANYLFGGDYFMANNFQNWAQINGYLKMTDSHNFIVNE